MSIRDLTNLKSDPTDLNILVMGPTGVGKSTWINSMAMYHSFDNFSRAEKAKISKFNLIPTDYIRIDDNGKKISIKIGESDNELRRLGKSHTIKPNHHCFFYDNRIVRIIDTPGIGDTDGIDKDMKNMQAVIHSIKGLTHINLIVILLEPNESRLTPAFEYCFKELIKQFHRSAAANIVFAFTKAVSSHFKLMDTRIPLNNLLAEIKEKQNVNIPFNNNNIFLFDNESYGYFCIKEIGAKVTIKKTEMSSYRKSYVHSRKELLRILRYAKKTVKSYNPQESVKLNLSRNVVQKLSGNAAMILTDVQRTLKGIKEREEIIKEYEGKENELEKRLCRPIKVVKRRMEKRHVVFCLTCAVEEFYTGDDRHSFIEADPSLAGEDPIVMYSGGICEKDDSEVYSCPTCGLAFKKMVGNKVFYTFHEVEMRLDEIVNNKINYIKESKSDLEILIEKETLVKDEITKELDTILKACAKFAAYLKKNSIVAFNDATDEYLRILMDLEEKKNGKQTDRYKGLSQMLKEYHAMKEILEKTYNTSEGNGDIMLEDIEQIITELCGLKYYGEDIATALSTIVSGEENSTAEKVHKIFIPVPLIEAFSKVWSRIRSLWS